MSMSANRPAFFALRLRCREKGDLFSARDRLRRGGVAQTPAPYTEKEIP
jgi:hypothetical protein